MAYWKAAGLSYLQYVNQSTSALRACVKPAQLSKYLIKEDVHYKKQAWTAGKASPKVYFTGSLTKAVAGYENPTGHLLGADAVVVKGA